MRIAPYRKTKSPYSRILIFKWYSSFYMIRKTKSPYSRRRRYAIFKSIFKSVFTLLHGQKDEITIFPNIDLVRYSNRSSRFYVIRMTMKAFPRISTWLIFKSVFAYLHDQKDDGSIFPIIDLATYSNRYSNRYLSNYTITMRKLPFSRISTWLDIQIDIQIGIRPST